MDAKLEVGGHYVLGSLEGWQNFWPLEGKPIEGCGQRIFTVVALLGDERVRGDVLDEEGVEDVVLYRNQLTARIDKSEYRRFLAAVARRIRERHPDE